MKTDFTKPTADIPAVELFENFTIETCLATLGHSVTERKVNELIITVRIAESEKVRLRKDGAMRRSKRERELIDALCQLCEATEKQRAANAGKESILVRMRRNNAQKILASAQLL